MNRVSEIVNAMSKERRDKWMEERRWIVKARKEMEEEVEKEIEREEEIKKNKKFCQVPHNTNYCYGCGNRRIEEVTVKNTGWYVEDRYNELHKQR